MTTETAIQRQAYLMVKSLDISESHSRDGNEICKIPATCSQPASEWRSHVSRFVILSLLLIFGINLPGCARSLCLPLCQQETEPAVVRAQSGDDVDPAFESAFQSPSSRQPPSEKTYPTANLTLEAEPAGGDELFAPVSRPLYVPESVIRGVKDEVKLDPQTPLAGVRFEGNTTIPAAAMLRYVKSRPGRTTTVDQVRDDVKSLYNTKWFFSIEPVYRNEAAGLVLVFKVQERPILKSVEYRGNEKFKENILAGLTGLKPMHAYSVATNREAVRRIKEYYVEKGYLFAEVNLLEGNDPEERNVVFEIIEGPNVKVTTVKFTGNEDISSEVLKLRLTTKKRILWMFGGKYDPTTIPEDVAIIKEYYHNIGYFDVQVQDRIDFSEDKSAVTVTFNVSEGPRYQIRNIQMEGNKIFSQEDLMSEFEVAQGQYFSARDLSKDISKIQQKYGELGRLFAKVNTSTVFTQQPGVVDLVVNIDEDRVYHIGMINVNIRGDYSHTKETEALNQMLIAPGEPADPEKIRKTKARLAGSAIWEAGGPDAPEINIRPVANPDYVLKEQVPNDLIVRASDEYFGDEKPLLPQTLNLPQEIQRKLQQTELIPTTMRQSREQLQQPNRQVLIPGAGHTLKTPVLQTPAQTQQPFIEHVPPSRSVQNELNEATSTESDFLTSETELQAPLYNLTDMQQTGVFQESGRILVRPMIFDSPEQEQPVIRGQNYDNYNNPPNLMYNETPQGDLLGPQLPSPVVPPGYVDLDVYLTEARTGRFMVGAGVNSDSGIVGNIVLEEQNFDIARFPTSFRDIVDGYAFRGGGQQFRLEATPGSEVSRYLVSWTDPFFLNTDYSLGVSGFFYQRFFRDWREERLGGRVNVGKLLTRELSFNTAIRLENVDIGNPRLAPGLAPSVDEILGNNFLGSGRFTLAYDTRDSTFMATEGYNLTGNVEQAFGDFDFTKFDFNASNYFTVYQRPDGAGKHVLSLRGSLGWTTDDTPAFERYYAGGFQTFRGFEFRSVSPLEPGDIGTNGAAVGGFFQFLGTAEYMLPVIANEAVRVVAFTDFGTVDEDVSFDKFRVSVGAGLRITVPQMGPVPIALDWAFPVVKEESDIRQIFSFYIGLTR